MLDQISVVIITKNAADTIRPTLESTQQFAEVVVYDNGSEDATLEILSDYTNVSIHQGEFMGFGPTKNHAVGLAKHDWVFSLDSDEVISEELLMFLKNWLPSSIHDVLCVRRDNYMMQRRLNKAGWGADWLVRGFNRTSHTFNDKKVHELVELHAKSNKHKVGAPIKHNALQRMGQLLLKLDLYTEIYRENSSKTYPVPLIIMKAWFAFVKSYFFQLGLLAGWRGLVISWNESNRVFFKYMKVYADNQSEKK